MPRLFARGSDGVVCIHTGADDVVDNPTSDLSRVLFHSSLDYPAIIATYTPSVTLPAWSLGRPFYNLHNLFAHGRPGIPFVLGYISNMSNIGLSGSVPVDSVPNYYARWVTLGANATNVVLHEDNDPGVGTARTLNLVIHVTDLLL